MKYFYNANAKIVFKKQNNNYTNNKSLYNIILTSGVECDSVCRVAVASRSRPDHGHDDAEKIFDLPEVGYT